MADDQNVVKRIVWSEIFSFPHIFKSFKMATQFHKLFLAFAAILLLFVGGYVMDSIWGVADSGRVMEGEILLHVSSSPDRFDEKIEQWRDGRLIRAASLVMTTKNDRRSLSAWRSQAGSQSLHFTQAFDKLRSDYVSTKEQGDEFASVQRNKILEEAEKNGDDWSDLLDEAETAHEYQIDKIGDLLGDVEEPAEVLIENDTSLKDADEDKYEENKKKARKKLDEALVAAKRAVTLHRLNFEKEKLAIEGAGIFESFITFERDCIYHAVMSVRYLNFTGGLDGYQNMVARRSAPAAALEVASGLNDITTVGPKDDQPGLVCYILLAAEGLRWLIIQHWVYAVIFLIWALAIWSLFGGAMYRMAAIRFAREEKISAGQALAFSQKKFFSFFSAPLVPIIAILCLGVLLMLGGLIGSIPVVGPLIMGILFFIAILMGFGIGFMAIGSIAGGALWYPVIAVEGSDSLDAFSRSVTYVFSRPFRAVFYGVVASIYGMVTYLFVRLFAYIALCSTHYFVKWGMVLSGDRMGADADLLDVLWPKPTFWNLHLFNWSAMGGWDSVCAILVSIWVLIVAGLVAAYLVTFFVSASTSIYFILRRREDATDLDEVYIEEADAILPEPEPAAEEEVSSETEESAEEGDAADSE